MADRVTFQTGSLAGPVSEEDIESLADMIRLDLPDFAYDPAYLAHIRAFNGGTPIECFYPYDGKYGGPIDSFLNFANPNTVERHIAYLNVNVVWSAIEDRLTIHQFPFAANAGGDYLCFDYSDGGLPRIVFWVAEKSEERNPCLEFLAKDFESFIESLRAEPC